MEKSRPFPTVQRGGHGGRLRVASHTGARKEPGGDSGRQLHGEPSLPAGTGGRRAAELDELTACFHTELHKARLA